MNKVADVKNALIGAFIGVLSILPGASGGIAAVVFGVYERMVNDLADIVHKIRTDFRFLFFIGGGLVLGMGVTAFGLDWLMTNLEVPAMFFFTGLIVGQFPDVFRMTQEDGEKSSVWNYLALVIGILITVLLVFSGNIREPGSNADITRSIPMYLLLIFTGLIIAASKIAPGVSGSAILLAMGLYKPLISAFTSFDWVVILFFGIGLIIGIFLFAKIVSWALGAHRKSTYFVIFGLTVGSTLIVAYNTIMVTNDWTEGISGIIALTIGLISSFWLSRISRKHNDEHEE
jgi:putative membrane protein